MRSLFIISAAVSVIAAPAQATCWTPEQAQAAQVRELDSMLMVSALRCRSTSDDAVAGYNRAMTHQRAPLTQANVVLRAHFAAEVGQAHALDAYDHFVTRAANRYGAGSEGLTCADFAAITEAVENEPSSLSALAALADRAGVQPVLDAPVCPVRFATLTH